jgi:hypothetical protein
MQKIALYTCVAIASSVLPFGVHASAAPLPPQAGLASPPHTLVELVRRGAEDDLKHKRHGRGGDDGSNHVSRSASSSGHGADDAAGHEHHSGGDDNGHGGNHGGGDDHGGRR